MYLLKKGVIAISTLKMYQVEILVHLNVI